MLNTSDAFRLLKLLLPHTPEDASEISVLVFGGKILTSMIQSGQHENYLLSVQLMTGKTLDVLVEQEVEQTFNDFVDGLIENEYLSLVSFYREMQSNG